VEDLQLLAGVPVFLQQGALLQPRLLCSWMYHLPIPASTALYQNYRSSPTCPIAERTLAGGLYLSANADKSGRQVHIPVRGSFYENADQRYTQPDPVESIVRNTGKKGSKE
jgi:hypothetical protein